MARAVLLDTCAAIWLLAGADMSETSRKAVDAAQDDDDGVYVSPITAWEIAMLVSRGRLGLSVTPELWFSMLLEQPGIRLAEMPPMILMASAFLPGTPPRDPADRIIAATSRHYRLALITRDREMMPYAAAGHLEVIVC